MNDENASGNCGSRRATPGLADLLDRLTPPDEARNHFRAARAEFLKGVRALLDNRIEQLSRTGQKGTTVPVE